MEDKAFDVLQKMSLDLHTISNVLTAVLCIICACIVGFLVSVVFRWIYESGKEDGKKGK